MTDIAQTIDFNQQFNSAHLDWLESESVHIPREVAAECTNPALLFSGGKDSIVVLHLALKAFRPNKLPFKIVHVDTGHNFPEVIAFRDKRLAEIGEPLVIGSVEVIHPKKARCACAIPRPIHAMQRKP